ncbi:MAG: DUF7507 domain-containing protein [Acidimicrobiia bacterium]
MKRSLALLAALVALLTVGVAVAQAAVIEVSIDTVVRADEGTVTYLATENTPADLIGTMCISVAEARNQSSVHPGNDLIVSSGGESVTLEDVERSPGATTTAGGPLTLGPTVTISLEMGPDEVFSGGITVKILDCTPPTTTMPPTTVPSTTTTVPSTTTTHPSGTMPTIDIVKTASPSEYGQDGIGHFIIEVTNPGPVNLSQVHVTDDIAIAMDPESDCAQPSLPDLAVGESYEYECSVANLDGVSPFTNEATAIGTGPEGKEVTDTDDAVVFPPVMSTTITKPPSTTPSTLPNTGVPYEQVRGFSLTGFALLLSGVALLGAAAFIGHRLEVHRMIPAIASHEIWIKLRPRSDGYTLFIPLRGADSDADESRDV